MDQIVLFPSGTVNQLPVLRALDLSLAGSIAAPSTSFDVIQSLDGEKYYILTRRATPSIVVASATTLQVLSTIDLQASVTDAELSPDGRYILAATGNLEVIDTATDQALAPIDVGGGPTKILLNDSATTAYVLANSGKTLSVIDMQSLSISQTAALPNAQNMALTGNGSRLIVSFNTGIRQYRTKDLSEISFIATKVPLINSTVYALPSGTKAIVENRGSGESRTAQIVDLDLATVGDIGSVGLTQLREFQIVDDAKGYAIDLTSNEVVLLDLTASPDVTITPMSFGSDARTIELSPNRRTLYVSSLIDASILAADVASNTVVASAGLPISPDAHKLVFGPSQSGPAQISINGGDEQYYPSNTTLPIPLSVEVTDAQGRPIPNIPVLFEDPTGAGLTISPAQPSFTNARGIATATIQFPARSAPEPVEGEVGDPAPILESIVVTATTGGLDPALFNLTLIRGGGLIKIAGDYQGVEENKPFPLPLVLLATDTNGFPLPANTPVTLGFSLASCPTELLTDENGFIRISNCSAFPVSTNPNNTQLFQKGTITASYFSVDQRQIRASFSFVVIRAGLRVTITKTAGDNQTARSGETLPIPLGFQLGRDGFGGTIDPFNVELRQISGPPVLLEKRSVPAIMFREQAINVKLGENAGTSVVEARLSVPGLPTITYTMTATGGRPTSIEKTGDNQSGKISTVLASPLRVRIINESGTFVPFPEVVWRVTQGDATLTTSSDATGASAVVQFGTTPGAVRVVAAVGSLQTTFTLTSLAPEPASISTFAGQNQTLTTGILSDPLTVRVTEIDNRPAAGAIITFSGPANVRLHPTNGATPGNPVQILANQDGLAGVQAELLAVSGLSEAGGRSQVSQAVTITASAGSGLSTSFLLSVVGRTPAFSGAGVVNAASFEAGLVPGGIVSIFGSGMMENVVGIVLANGQTSFQGTTVRIGGIPAPIFALAANTTQEQINVQVPFELTPGQSTTVEIENNGSRATVGGVPVFAAQPGVFQDATGFAAAVHADNRLVTAENPARNGEVIALFATGAGRITPPVATGTLGPSSQLSFVDLPVVIGVDDKGAEVLFKGYAPGFLGLYQFNFVVPTDARCGQRALSLKVGDRYSPNVTIPILCP
ncbi:MAG: hypothetical protein H6509_15585 [Bryobacterales bacterium]|nr:hypothetical protein [Bryobacterales bacterium]